MQEFEVSGDRNNFIDLKNFFLEIICEVIQSCGANLKHDARAPIDNAKTNAPYICNNMLHSLFSDCTVSANGLKLSNANGNYAHKSFIQTEFFHNEDAKNTWLQCQGYSFEENMATKHRKLEILEAYLYVRKMTLTDNVMSAIDKTLLSSPASYPTSKP